MRGKLAGERAAQGSCIEILNCNVIIDSPRRDYVLRAIRGACRAGALRRADDAMWMSDVTRVVLIVWALSCGAHHIVLIVTRVTITTRVR